MPPAPAPIVVTFALAQEAAPFRRLAPASPAVRLVLTGIGRANAEQAVQRLLAEGPPRLLITAGFAGALNPEMKVGDVLFDADPGSRWAALVLAAGARPAAFYCAPRMLITAAEKAGARHTTGADAVEMESEYLRQACRAAGVPALTVRAISDTATEDLPLDFNRLTRAGGKLSASRLAGAILRRPTSIPALWRLQQQSHAAALALARVLVQILRETRAHPGST